MGVCVVENLSWVFLSEWPPLHLWVMKVYIVWVKGKKVTLKNPPSFLLQRDYAEPLSSLAYRIPQYARLHPPSLTGFFWQFPKASQAPKHSLHFE